MTKLKVLALGCAAAALALTACDSTPGVEAPESPPPAIQAEAHDSAAAADPVISPAERERAARGQAAIEDALADPDPFARTQRLATLLPSLGPEAIPAVRSILEDDKRDLAAAEIELLVRYWAGHRGEQASRWALEKSDAFSRGIALYTALLVWAENDPQGATDIAWAWANIHPAFESTVPVALVRGWFAAGDPPELTQFIKNLGLGLHRQRAISTYVRVLVQTRGPEALTRWAEAVPEDDEPYKLAVNRQAAASLQQFDHASALRFCENHCEGPYGGNLRTMIARRWMRKDGPASLAWLETAPESAEKDFAVRTTYALWSHGEREAAVAWMAARMQGGPTAWIQPIFPAYALALAPDAPVEAISLAEKLEDDDEREWILIQVAREWRKTDEAAAEAWLKDSQLSEQARAKARAPEPRKRKGMMR